MLGAGSLVSQEIFCGFYVASVCPSAWSHMSAGIKCPTSGGRGGAFPLREEGKI